MTAAKAVEEAFKNKYPAVETKNVDVIDYANSLYKKIFVDGYNFVSAKKPELWGWLYHKFNDPSVQKLPSLLSRLAIEGKFIPLIKDFKPDFIVATHPLPMVLISHSKEKNVIDIASSLVVTDFGCHSFWVDPEVNYYFVATDSVSKCLANYGAKSEQFVVTGIPIELKFSQDLDRQAIDKKLGLVPELPTVLIVGGQFSFAALQKIYHGIQKEHAKAVQFIVVAGRDKALKLALENLNIQKSGNVKTFGFVSNMQELMTASDLIFSKAGGLTVSECMAKSLPMVINKVIPGQEEDNVNYLVSKGAAIKVDNFAGIVEAVNDLLDNPEKIKKMKEAAGKIGKPNSATELADFVMNKIK